MDYCFNRDFTIREEYFGSLLFARGGTPAWELDPVHGAFLKALYYTDDYGLSIQTAAGLYGLYSFNPHLDKLLEIGAVREGGSHRRNTIGKTELKEKLLDELERASRRKCLKAPTMLTLYVTMDCQQDCSFCFIDGGLKGSESVPGHEQWMKLIEEAGELGVPSIAVLGGEPTLYPELDKLIAFAGKRGISLALTSNGLNIPDPVIKALKENRNSLICLSLESISDSTHRDTVGNDQSRVLRSVAKLNENDVRFNINTIGLGQSEEELKAIADFCADSGAEVWFLNMLYRKDETSELFPGLEWYARTDTMLERYIAEKYRGKMSYQLFGCQLYWTYSEEKIRARKYSTVYNRLISGCAAGSYQLDVLPDGTALPCINLDYRDYDCGNVFASGLREVWENSPALDKVRYSIALHSNCRDCFAREVCRGGCPARRTAPFDLADCGMDPLCPVTDCSARVMPAVTESFSE